MMDINIVKISVIIPVYNVKQYLKAAVDSILCQTLTAYEVIIVNDGSTDGSGDYLMELYGLTPIVKIIHTENRGLGEARNEGARHASGDFVYYFDSDDIADSILLQSFASALSIENDMDIYCFSADSFLDSNLSMVSAPSLPSYKRNLEMVYPNGVLAFNSLSKHGVFYPNAWLYIFKRKLLVGNNLSFKAIIHEDEEFTPRLFFCANKVVVQPLVLFHRRVRAGSIMQTSRSEKNILGYIESIKSLMRLKDRANSKQTSKCLTKRITINLVAILSIIKDDHVLLSSSVYSEVSELIEKNINLSLSLAKISPTLYRVYSAVERRFFKLTKA